MPGTHAESMPYSGRCDQCTIIFETGMKALREMPFEEWWAVLDTSNGE